MVRHPLDRFVSHFSYLKPRNNLAVRLAHIKRIDDYAATIENNDPSVMGFRGVVPQWSFVASPSGDDMCVNELLRYETLGAEFLEFCRRAGLGERELPHLNKSSGRSPGVGTGG